MNTIIAGILLPNTLFQNPWYMGLGAFVAFNTILFVGLSFGKIFFWPKPRVPAQFIGDQPGRARKPALPTDGSN